MNQSSNTAKMQKPEPETKAFFWHKGFGFRPYEPKDAPKVFKFIGWYLADGRLIILAGPSNLTLANHSDLIDQARETGFDQGLMLVRFQAPEIAGTASMGKIMSWESRGYELETPLEMRDSILEALGLQI